VTAAPIGIAGIGTYFPAGYQTSREVAEATGIPRDVIEDRFGLRGKHVAGDGEHVSDLAIRAAQPLLDGIDPEEIDAVIYFGSAHKDYHVWSVAPLIAHRLGLARAFTFELMNTSACGPVALKVAKDMLAAEPDMRTVLLSGATREARLIDYRNPRARVTFSFGDGGAAALLRRGPAVHEVLATAITTDGSFAHDVLIPAGGSVHPPSSITLERRMHYWDVPEQQRMKDRLDPIFLKRTLEVIHRAVVASGCTIEEIDFLAPQHMKRSLFRALLDALGLDEVRSFYLEDFGHMSAIDPFVVLSEAARQGRLRAGDLVIAVAVGLGYTWAATVVRW
jgi:3-oxoacyl-[acyl-carrier-protein] synthase III